MADLKDTASSCAFSKTLCASAMLVASGFSQKTCLPVSIAAIASETCCVFGVVTKTASDLSSSSRAVSTAVAL